MYAVNTVDYLCLELVSYYLSYASRLYMYFEHVSNFP
jgi:hypothetical protein